jgi:hypothetical protein
VDPQSNQRVQRAERNVRTGSSFWTDTHTQCPSFALEVACRFPGKAIIAIAMHVLSGCIEARSSEMPCRKERRGLLAAAVSPRRAMFLAKMRQDSAERPK